MTGDLTQTAHRRRLWVRAYNGVAGLFPVKTASVEQMLRLAERRAKHAEWGPTRFREGLEILVKSYNEDALSHPLGRKLVYDRLVDRLVQRAQVVRTLSEQPHITEQPVTSPVLIAGLARTGTTFLHRVLARDPRLRAPLCWETEEPAPPPHPDSADTDPRVKKYDRNWKLLFHLAPRGKVIHAVASTLPEECYPLLERSFTCLNLALILALPEYQRWLWSAPPDIVDAAYQFYRHQLQLLQVHYPPRRWVLRAPAHAPFVDGFVRAFPDAKIIYTHRDMVAAVGSLASLITTVRSIAYRTIDPKKIGEEALDIVDHMTRRFMRARSSLPAGYFCDVHYDRLTRDPMSVLHDIYARLGLAFGDDTQAPSSCPGRQHPSPDNAATPPFFTTTKSARSAATSNGCLRSPPAEHVYRGPTCSSAYSRSTSRDVLAAKGPFASSPTSLTLTSANESWATWASASRPAPRPARRLR